MERPIALLCLWLCLWLGAAVGAPATAADDAALAAGRAIAADRNRGNCLACHWVEGAEMTGNSGPPLVAMKQRYPERAALRAQIHDPRRRNPETLMPPYGAHGILSQRELELVVDYVHAL